MFLVNRLGHNPCSSSSNNSRSSITGRNSSADSKCLVGRLTAKRQTPTARQPATALSPTPKFGCAQSWLVGQLIWNCWRLGCCTVNDTRAVGGRWQAAAAAAASKVQKNNKSTTWKHPLTVFVVCESGSNGFKGRANIVHYSTLLEWPLCLSVWWLTNILLDGYVTAQP